MRRVLVQHIIVTTVIVVVNSDGINGKYVNDRQHWKLNGRGDFVTNSQLQGRNSIANFAVYILIHLLKF